MVDVSELVRKWEVDFQRDPIGRVRSVLEIYSRSTYGELPGGLPGYLTPQSLHLVEKIAFPGPEWDSSCPP
jgi:hypothetical protein